MANTWKSVMGARSEAIVILTGDVHHWSLHSLPEFDYAMEYLDVVRRTDISSTLFLTGRCVRENIRRFEACVDEHKGHVEFGCHTYDAHYLLLGHRYHIDSVRGLIDTITRRKTLLGTRKLLATAYYVHDVGKCIREFADVGIRPICWRTHGYRRSPSLYRQLLRFGFRVVSDVHCDTFRPFPDSGLLQVPITLADDVMFDFNYVVSNPVQAFKLLRNKINWIINSDSSAQLQLHPLYMKIIGFKRMEELIRQFIENNYTFLTMLELYELTRRVNRAL